MVIQAMSILPMHMVLSLQFCLRIPRIGYSRWTFRRWLRPIQTKLITQSRLRSNLAHVSGRVENRTHVQEYSAFTSTRIHPLDPKKVLKQLKVKTPSPVSSDN
jgi:hypothetical protein